MIRPLFAVLAASLLLPASAADAEEVRYDFEDPKGVNGIAFINDSPLEPFVGFGKGVTGTVSFDPDAPGGFSGSISVAADTLQVTNEQMTQHMLSDGWLAASEGMTFDASFESVEQVSTTDAGATVLEVKGTMTYGSIEVDKTYTIEATIQKDGAAERGPKNRSGDLLVLRSDFTIDRTDFGIKPEMDGSEVAKKIYVMVRIVGYEAQ
ncbi:YceI family protein [Phycisphaera mikurensis]|uniref:Lipid/polyisoprenoid-binding YceI-like domain-containing protein n=1 Tax=Phycisphaera mikurensis (strain NBRC 102666 / KCTC 22515 / FYK2301M01) TaxID=1142394 RepID=I0IFI7_PHYMF|nr:YceI family protein [Phycisphaera mikurensis]MBB6440583.1 polyisoprenoid-binding protein YceI [Phycisphaera mikurensis]BAM04025.1 hypothetical protein PSMK_18660 [Phycisphaera mikurensis NBRC 102666]